MMCAAKDALLPSQTRCMFWRTTPFPKCPNGTNADFISAGRGRERCGDTPAIPPVCHRHSGWQRNWGRTVGMGRSPRWLEMPQKGSEQFWVQPALSLTLETLLSQNLQPDQTYSRRWIRAFFFGLWPATRPTWSGAVPSLRAAGCRGALLVGRLLLYHQSLAALENRMLVR